MFSGIIKHRGRITDLHTYGTGYQCVITLADQTLFTCERGDSVAVNGICSTVRDMTGTALAFDYLSETKHRTTLAQWQRGDWVNIEPSLKLSDRIHGHLVTGHVDTTASITAIDVDTQWHIISFSYPEAYWPYIAEKGSVALDGVGLTVVHTEPGCFTVHLVPHTISHTGFKDKQVGDRVNLEVDMMARYIQHAIQAQCHEKPRV